MFDHLVRTAGFPWAIRAIGFVALAAALLSIPALLSGSAWLKHKRKRRALFDKTALHDRLFLIFTACSFSTFLGYIVPYFYIPTYARERLGSNVGHRREFLRQTSQWRVGAFSGRDCYMGALCVFEWGISVVLDQH